MAYTDERAGASSAAGAGPTAEVGRRPSWDGGGEGYWSVVPDESAEEASSDEATTYRPAGGPRHALQGGNNRLWERVRRIGRPEQFVTFVVVAASVIFVLVQFEPSNLFRNTTVAGGDTGAHVILPWIAQHQLLPNLRLTGWTSSNWDGFPAVTFYFPMPVYSIVALAQVFPYDIAFKLGTAAPMILMPVAGCSWGAWRRRLSRARVLAAATLPYMFGTEYSIYGAISLDAGRRVCLRLEPVVRPGVPRRRHARVADGPLPRPGGGVVRLHVHVPHRPDDVRGHGPHRAHRALRVAQPGLAGGAVVAVPTLVVAGCIAAWWALPFELRFPYVTNMGYTRNTDYLAGLFPQSNPNDTWLFVLATLGAGLSLVNRRRIGEFFSIMAVLAALAFRFMPQSILWNNRVLPFWFLASTSWPPWRWPSSIGWWRSGAPITW